MRNTRKQNKIRILHQNPENLRGILKQALRIYGPDQDLVLWMASVNAGLPYPLKTDDLPSIDAYQWFRLSQYLGLPAASYQSGYSLAEHISGIMTQCSSGTYPFPRGLRIRAVTRRLSINRREQAINKRSLYGRKLHTKLYIADLLEKARSLPSYFCNRIRASVTLLISRVLFFRLIKSKHSSNSYRFYRIDPDQNEDLHSSILEKRK